MYVKFIDSYACYYSVAELYRDNPNTSFPQVPTNECLAEWNVYSCQPKPPPAVDYTQNLTLGEPVNIEGQWTQTWSITPASAEEVAAKVEAQWAVIRTERNAKLFASDWTQVADAPVNALDWGIYRQALRDLTDQTDPFNIIWPEVPA